MTEPMRETTPEWLRHIAMLGHVVQELRQMLGLSQQTLADRAGISQGAISRLESGEHPEVPLISVARVAQALSQLAPWVDGVLPRTQSALFELARDLPPSVTGKGEPPDPGLRRLLNAYWLLTPPRRAVLIELVLPLASYLNGAPWVPTPTEVPPPVTEET